MFKPGLLAALLALLVLAGCASDSGRTSPLFEAVPPTRSGVAFTNELPVDTSFNILNYLYYYDGAGVAVGDLDNDGLPDLYFTANRGPNRLYRNKGDLVFEDVTERAGVAGIADWTTGATMADVNGDGYLDLYVSAVAYLGMQGRNALFINNGDGTFTDRAADYGLDFSGYATQAAFFDYDRDGDLDVYLLNHSVHNEETYGEAALLRYERHPRAGDRLYRNDGERFTDVSEAAGIYGGRVGYGLGIAVSDLDRDGCPDLYVANDFHENDYLYYNNCDGTFTEALEQATGHTSLSSMGNDAADFNNDGLPDVVVLDMQPAREDIYKSSAGAETYDIYNLKRFYGYYHQYARNTLQLNRSGRRFSEIGYLAGISATDWSWAALFADLDNDGLKDLFVTNGIYRRPNDLDYIEYISNPQVQAALERGITQAEMALIDRMPQVKIPNYAFRNNGDLTFTDRAAAWGLAHEGFSNGAAYADLDNDGDLDLIVSNINEPSLLYENHADTLTGHHYLSLTLHGTGGNTAGLGAGVVVKTQDGLQFQELMPTRGFQSSVDPRLHFGLGTRSSVDTLIVTWPDGRRQLLTNLAADRMLTLRQEDAGPAPLPAPHAPAQPLFTDVTAELALDYRHRENAFNDFNREPLIPRKLSTEGPALAVGDVNGDGLDDLFAGGAKWQAARLLVQQPDGRFQPSDEALWRADSLYEDVDAAFFDADGDGDPDLYVVSGGNEFWGEAEALRDRLYLNDGGAFRRAERALPDFYANGACVVPGDFDADGDVDLFVGSRVVTRNYGLAPASHLLENDGTGRFTDVTATRAEGLAEAGMVTSAAWTDYDGDGRLDLVVVGEWMPIRVFAQQEGRFVERTAEAGLTGTNGWWNTVAAEDLDGDGDVDLAAGNLGLNAMLKAGPTEPVRLYVKDFDEDGSLEQILTYYRNGVPYPMASVDLLMTDVPTLQKHYTSYRDFGARRIEDLFPPDELKDALVEEAYTFATSYAENRGDGTFTLRALPVEAQFAPVNAILAEDVDGDGRRDLLLAGNFYGTGPILGRYDASYGLFLHGDGRGAFEPVDPGTSNLWLEGEIRHLQPLRRADGERLLVAARNDAPLQVLRIRTPTALSAGRE